MAEINIAGVNSGSKTYTVHVVLTADQNPEDPEEVTILGEAFLEMPEATEMADVKSRILDAAQAIMDKHKDALDKKKDIEALEFPPIV